jgi:ketopantoate reductase
MSNNVFEEVMTTTRNTAPDSKSSLLLDIENGRENEIETLNGTLVKFAKELKIKVPVNELIYKNIQNYKK